MTPDTKGIKKEVNETETQERKGGTAMKHYQLKIWFLDVWGDREEFFVNDWWSVMEDLVVSEEVLSNDKKLIKTLRKRVLKPRLHFQVEDCEDFIVIWHKGLPVLHLEIVKEY